MTQIDTNKLVTVDNLTWGYPSQRILFHEFDFQLSKGDFCFVVGDSGSGKTSLMKLITGQIQAPAHSVYIQ
ncbi:MAG: ATP-binding cassette domain-containing protein [bacterium]